MLGNYLEIYEAQTKRGDIRSYRGGGDVVTTLLVYGMEKRIVDKALVAKMSDTEPWKAVATIATTPREIISAAGSKYAFVPHGKLVKELTSKSALVGLPCQTRVRGEYLKIGLFCGFCYSERALDYLFKKIRIKKENIASLRYRVPYTKHLVIYLKNGEKIDMPNPSWLVYFFPYKKCIYCTDFSNHHADISVGDIRPDWSVVLARTKKGKDIFERTIKEGYLNAHKMRLEDYLKTHSGCLLQKELYGGYVTAKFSALRGKWIEYKPMFALRILGKIIARVMR